MTSWYIITEGEESTFRLGVHMGRLLHPGDFVSLVGDLGAGKTQLAKGIAEGLGVMATVTSPTYTLLNIYEGRHSLYHFDLYRLGGDDDVSALGFSEYFYGNGISLVEWADRLQDELPEERLTVVLEYVGPLARRISFEPHGHRYEGVVDSLKEEREDPSRENE